MFRGMIVVSACLALGVVAPQRTRAQLPSSGPEVTSSNLAVQLGLKTAPDAPVEVDLGRSITCTLDDPDKLAKHGIKGMHEGARVTITRVAPDRIRIEADELDPAPFSGAVTLKVGVDGSLTTAPERAPAKPPGA